MGWALGLACAGVLGFVAAADRGDTLAAFSDLDVVAGNQASADTWADPVDQIPVLPSECTTHGIVPVNVFLITDEGSFYSDGSSPLERVGPSKPGSTTNGSFDGTPASDLIVNVGGTRTLHGWGGDDCIVAGPGDDILKGGTGADTLIGGKQQQQGEHLYPAASP